MISCLLFLSSNSYFIVCTVYYLLSLLKSAVTVIQYTVSRSSHVRTLNYDQSISLFKLKLHCMEQINLPLCFTECMIGVA